jgi:hypothetical protein
MLISKARRFIYCKFAAKITNIKIIFRTAQLYLSFVVNKLKTYSWSKRLTLGTPMVSD